MTPTLELVFFINVICFTILSTVLFNVHKEARADMLKLRKDIAIKNHDNINSINRRFASYGAKTDGWYSMLEKQNAGHTRRLEKLEDRVAKIFKAIVSFKKYYEKALADLDRRILDQEQDKARSYNDDWQAKPQPKGPSNEPTERFNTPLSELTDDELLWWIAVALDHKDVDMLIRIDAEVGNRHGCLARFMGQDSETIMKMHDVLQAGNCCKTCGVAIPTDIRWCEECTATGPATPTHHTCSQCSKNFPINEMYSTKSGLACGYCFDIIAGDI